MNRVQIINETIPRLLVQIRELALFRKKRMAQIETASIMRAAGKSYKEIALALSVSITTVMTLVEEKKQLSEKRVFHRLRNPSRRRLLKARPK
jgi:hypothetical protein